MSENFLQVRSSGQRSVAILYPLEFGIALDKSGSMYRYTDPVIAGFNHLISEQKKIAPNVATTLIQFGETAQVYYDNEPIDQLPVLNTDRYLADGDGTALLDGIGKTIKLIGQRFDSAAAGSLRVLIAILSDGLENSSREWMLEEIQSEINFRRLEDKWEFVYLAVGPEAARYALKLSIPKSNIFQLTGEEIEPALLKFSKAVEQLRLGRRDYLRLMQ